MAIHGDTLPYIAMYRDTLPHVATHSMSKSCHTKKKPMKNKQTPQIFESFFLFLLFKNFFYFWSPTSSTFFKKENTNDFNHPFNHRLFTSHSHNRRLGTHSKIAREALCISACKVNVHTLIVCVCTHITPMQPRAWCTPAKSLNHSAFCKCASSVQQINTYL